MGKLESMSWFIEKWEEMVRRQDERTGRQALTDDTKRAIVMDMCPVHLERHPVLNSDWHGTDPKAKSAIRDDVEQTWHRSAPLEIDDMSYPTEEEHDCQWEEAYAVGHANRKGKRKSKGKGKDGKGAWKGAGNGQSGKSWRQGDTDQFACKCHDCGEKEGKQLWQKGCLRSRRWGRRRSRCRANEGCWGYRAMCS